MAGPGRSERQEEKRLPPCSLLLYLWHQQQWLASAPPSSSIRGAPCTSFAMLPPRPWQQPSCVHIAVRVQLHGFPRELSIPKPSCARRALGTSPGVSLPQVSQHQTCSTLPQRSDTSCMERPFQKLGPSSGLPGFNNATFFCPHPWEGVLLLLIINLWASSTFPFCSFTNSLI